MSRRPASQGAGGGRGGSRGPRGGRGWRRRLEAVLAIALIGVVAVCNLRLLAPRGPRAAIAQLRFLEGALVDGAAEDMQRWFPEGRVFTWALYGLASARTAMLLPPDDPRRARLLAASGAAVDTVFSDRARSTFVRDMSPEWGVFYTSWSLYAAAEHLRATGASDPARVERFRLEADRLAAALDASPTPFLQSYPGSSWPADTSVGVAALAIHDRVLPSRYGATVRRWVSRARERTSPDLGALGHTADPRTGASGEVRGSSLALMARVLVDVDSDFAREQYRVLRDRFVRARWGGIGVLEYADGRYAGGDVDSGPLVLGFSGPALVVGMAAARANGDARLGRILLGVTELVGLPWGVSSRRYAGGLVPVGDAFIAWARSGPPTTDARWDPRLPWWWPVPVQLLFFLVALRAWVVLCPIARKDPGAGS